MGGGDEDVDRLRGDVGGEQENGSADDAQRRRSRSTPSMSWSCQTTSAGRISMNVADDPVDRNGTTLSFPVLATHSVTRGCSHRPSPQRASGTNRATSRPALDGRSCPTRARGRSGSTPEPRRFIERGGGASAPLTSAVSIGAKTAPASGSGASRGRFASFGSGEAAGVEYPAGQRIQLATIVAASAIRWSFVQGGPILARGPCRASSARPASILTA